MSGVGCEGDKLVNGVSRLAWTCRIRCRHGRVSTGAAATTGPATLIPRNRRTPKKLQRHAKVTSNESSVCKEAGAEFCVCRHWL